MYKDDLYYKSQEMLSGMMNEAEEKRKGEVSNFRESWKLDEEANNFPKDIDLILRTIKSCKSKREGKGYGGNLLKAENEIKEIKQRLSKPKKDHSQTVRGRKAAAAAERRKNK